MSRFLFGLMWVLLLIMLNPCVRADTLEDIARRGALRWGGDASGGGPYIFQGPDNQLTGFEFELAQYLAERLGVSAEYVNWEWEMLPQILDRGTIDVVLNGYEWSAEREQLWSSTVPYYIYKLQLLAHNDNDSITSWDDLRAASGEPRKRVGVLQGSAAERYVEKRLGDSVELKKFPEVTSVMGLVSQGQLDATVQDLPIAIHYGADFPRLRRVGAPEEPGYYVAFVRAGDERLRARLNEAIAAAIADGTLRRIYEKYGVWNDDQERLATVAQNWPPVVPDAPSRWANLPHYARLLLRAAWTTMKLSFASMPLAMLLGLIVAIGRLYGPVWIRVPFEVYVEFLRGTPLLLQLFVIYYVLPQFTGITIPEFWAGVLGLAINYSAYEAENYRAGLLAIPRGQMEAALSLGMSTPTALRRVIVPQAVRIVIPPVTNDFIALFKDTSVCSMIAVTELTGMYRFLFQSHPRLMLEFGLMTALLYLLMSYPLSLIARRMETQFKKVTV
ncbi:MAG TPA: ABC transporter permease subunit [Lacipirellulaceae bacterium]|nr:ABC transporter permease subunit [Lacipirellulaceae bacterium]